MVINITVENRQITAIEWNLPYLPQLGHKLYLVDFIGEEQFDKLSPPSEDFYIVKDIIWSIDQNNPRVDLYVEKQ